MTNLPLETAPLAEVGHLHGLRHWVEQGYKHMKDQLGWDDFRDRTDRGIRRHWVLVCSAFAFCWQQEARQAQLRNRDSPPMREKNRLVGLPVCCRWPRLLRTVRARLTPLHWLAHCWRTCFATPPPAELATLVQFLIGKDGSNLYPRR